MTKITFITSSCVTVESKGMELTVEYELNRDELEDIYALSISDKAVDSNNAEVAFKWSPEDYSAVLKRIRYYNYEKNITA